jgi:hypothetical protein
MSYYHDILDLPPNPPMMSVENMQRVFMYFFNEIHPTMSQNPDFIKFRNGVWLMRRAIFENPFFSHWMMDELQSNWQLLHLDQCRDHIIVFVYFYVRAFMWYYPEIDPIVQMLEKGIYSEPQPNAREVLQREVRWYMTEDTPFLIADKLTNFRVNNPNALAMFGHRTMDLVPRGRVSNAAQDSRPRTLLSDLNYEIEKTLKAFYRVTQRNLILNEREKVLKQAISARPIEKYTSIRNLSPDIIHRLIRESRIFELQSSYGPSPHDVGSYITGLLVWHAFDDV